MSPATTQRATVQTSSGRYIDLLDPKPADILIEDIAHALSNIARFNGHTHQFYSVAQHCVLCSGINPDKLALEKLLHDATEAYVGDMVTPIKNLFPGYRTMEDKIAGVIAQAFGLNQGFHHDPEVKRSDLIMLIVEKHALLQANPEDQIEWARIYQDFERLGFDRQLPLDQIGCEPLIPWQPVQAKQAFLDRFGQLYSASWCKK